MEGRNSAPEGAKWNSALFETLRLSAYVGLVHAEKMVTVEIVLLAMVALFVGLRLYSVLGRRTGHEQQPILRPAETARAPEAPAQVAESGPERPEEGGIA